MKGRVLVISRYFPPGGGVGAFRSAKFVKYLPEFGWEPYVISLPPERQKRFLPEDSDDTQYSSIAEIPKEHIYIDVPFKSIKHSLGDLQRLPLFAKKLPKIIKRYDIDVVFHTAPPFYSLPNLIWTSRRIDSPYIIDLREPWYINNQMFDETKSTSSHIWRYINKILEESTLRYSDKVTLDTKNMELLYREKYPKKSEQFISITNGYDPNDYRTNYTTDRLDTDLQIIHPGKFMDNMWGFLIALKQINQEYNADILHFGNKRYKYTKKFYEQSEELGVDKAVSMNGYAEFEKVVGNIKNSDVGLVVARRNDPTHVPQKTFDYIACNIPILGLGPIGGELDEILRPFENAYLVNHENHKKIVEVLELFIKTKPATLGTEEERQKYTRRNMTEKLVDVFNTVT